MRHRSGFSTGSPNGRINSNAFCTNRKSRCAQIRLGKGSSFVMCAVPQYLSIVSSRRAGCCVTYWVPKPLANVHIFMGPRVQMNGLFDGQYLVRLDNSRLKTTGMNWLGFINPQNIQYMFLEFLGY